MTIYSYTFELKFVAVKSQSINDPSRAIDSQATMFITLHSDFFTVVFRNIPKVRP